MWKPRLVSSSAPDDDDAPELTLDALRDAFAEAIGSGRTEGPTIETSPPDTAQGAMAAVAQPSATEPPARLAGHEELSVDPQGAAIVELSPVTILEALLFVGDPSGQPLAATRLASVMRGVEPHEIGRLAQELNRRYQASGRPLEVCGDGAGFRLELRGEFQNLAANLQGRVRQARLTQGAIDVLALVAYHQPIDEGALAARLGKPCGGILNQLVRRQLIRPEEVTAETDAAASQATSRARRRQVHYRTTERFLQVFQLQSLADLPAHLDFDPP